MLHNIDLIADSVPIFARYTDFSASCKVTAQIFFTFHSFAPKILKLLIIEYVNYTLVHSSNITILTLERV